jgi:hypothetical protein
MKTIIASDMGQTAIEHLVYMALENINQHMTSVHDEQLGNLVNMVAHSFHDDEGIITHALVSRVRSAWALNNSPEEFESEKEDPKPNPVVYMYKTFFGSPADAVHGYQGYLKEYGIYARIEVITFYLGDVEAYEVMITYNQFQPYMPTSECNPMDDYSHDSYTAVGHTEFHRGWVHARAGGKLGIIDEIQTRFNIKLDYSKA